jgi:hypothetical protein
MRDAMEVDHGCCVTDLDDVVVLRELRGGASARRKHRHDKECRGSGDGDADEGVPTLDDRAVRSFPSACAPTAMADLWRATSASTDVGANGIDQRCGWGEARSVALVDWRDDYHAPGGQPL